MTEERVELAEIPNITPQEQSKRTTLWARLGTKSRGQADILAKYSNKPQFLTLSNDVLVVVIPILDEIPDITAEDLSLLVNSGDLDQKLLHTVWRYIQVYRQNATPIYPMMDS